MIAEEIFKNKSWVVTASWIAFVIGGIVVAVLVLAFYTLSIFVAGATGGVMLAMLVTTSFGYKIYPSHPTVILIILAIIFGIVCGVLALKFEKPVIIVATAFIGAGLVVWGVGYFAGDFPRSSDLKSLATQNGNGDWVYSIPSAWWGYLVGIIVLTALGAMVQFRKTGRGVKHTRDTHKGHGIHWHRAQTPNDHHHHHAHHGNPVSHA